MSTSATLRAELDSRAADDEHFNLRTIVASIVPLITELAERHQAGETVFVHPSVIAWSPSGCSLIEEEAGNAPELHHDKACLAPEQRHGKVEPGDARTSVFAIGAILYEMATGKCVGPGMRRPAEIVPGIPETFETLLGKALVGDAHARPADLGALGQALHHCAPMASIPPPHADESHLDHDQDFDVDISLSLMPPAPAGGQQKLSVDMPVIPRPPALGGIMAVADAEPVSVRGAGSTAQLAELKAALESDPRPRYVVIKEGMDHGPFTAVELLQQIAQSQFREEHFLRDVIIQEEKQLALWEEFAPFAKHAHLNRQVTHEKKALETKVVQEQVQTQNKALIGIAVLALAAAAFGGWWFRIRQSDDVRMGVSGDEAQAIDFDTGLEGKKAGGPQGRWAGGARSDGDGPRGPMPVLAGGMSCEGARNAYVEEYKMGAGSDVPPDLSAGAYGAVLNRGTYLNSCGVPPDMSVSVGAAVQNGRAVGVTVRTNPANGGVSSCISGQIRSMGFPSHPRLDITSTVFKAE
jgi:hypothetical protein